MKLFDTIKDFHEFSIRYPGCDGRFEVHAPFVFKDMHLSPKDLKGNLEWKYGGYNLETPGAFYSNSEDGRIKAIRVVSEQGKEHLFSFIEYLESPREHFITIDSNYNFTSSDNFFENGDRIMLSNGEIFKIEQNKIVYEGGDVPHFIPEVPTPAVLFPEDIEDLLGENASYPDILYIESIIKEKEYFIQKFRKNEALRTSVH